MKISILPDCIADCRNAGRSLWLWGQPGTGKTAIVNAAAQLLGIDLVSLRVVEHEPVDFGGFPVPHADGLHVRRLRETWLPQEGTTGLLFLDELAQATIETQCAAMRLIDHLPDGWSVVAASNRTTDRAGVRQPPAHVLERFTHVEIEPDLAGWISWTHSTTFSPLVRGFLEFRPSLFCPDMNAANVQATRTACNPRAWHGVSRIVMKCRTELHAELIAGTIGTGPAAEFLGYCRIAADCPTPAQILADPRTISIPADPSALYAVCSSLAEHCKWMDNSLFPKLMEFAERLPVEFAAIIVIDAQRAKTDFVKLPATAAWIARNQSVFARSRS